MTEFVKIVINHQPDVLLVLKMTLERISVNKINRAPASKDITIKKIQTSLV